MPHADGFLTAGSLLGQLLLSRKKIENWIVWIVVDILYVVLYVYKDLMLDGHAVRSVRGDGDDRPAGLEKGGAGRAGRDGSQVKAALLRVAILGAESSGKSTLAAALAERLGTVWVPEYLREFVETKGQGAGGWGSIFHCRHPARARA